MNTLTSSKSFTLTEILVTAIIIGLIAAIAIPNYHKSVEVSYEQDAVTQLKAIHQAQLLYRIGNGQFTQASSLDDLNTKLNLGIIANGFTYGCDWGGDTLTHYTCQVSREDASYGLEIHEDGIPKCSISGGCPSCTTITCL